MAKVKLYNILDKKILFDASSLKFIQLTNEVADTIDVLSATEKEEYLNALSSSEPLKPRKPSRNNRECDKVAFILSKDCNLKCKYCYEDFNFGIKEKKHMNLEDAKKAIDFIATHYDSVRTFTFFGGEPLLNYGIIGDVCEYILSKFKESPPIFSIITNGTILNDEILTLLNKYRIGVFISLDGTKETHDMNRIYLDGRGSHHKIIENIGKLNESRTFSLCVQAGVSRSVFDFSKERGICLTEYFRSLGIDGLHLFPVSSSDPSESFDDVPDKEFEEFFMREMFASIDSVATDNPLPINALSIMFDNISNRTIHEAGCEISMGNHFINQSGDVYNCPMLLSDPKMKIGNIHNPETLDNILNSHRLMDEVNYETIAKCQECDLKNICNVCPAFNYINNGSFSAPADVVCRYNHVLLKCLLYKMSDFVVTQV